jgi:hypothetical protein
MADKTSQLELTKEVLAPQNPYSGLGVVIVASLAMFMAVASSALVLRARMARSCAMSARAYHSELPAAVDWHASASPSSRRAERAETCGVPEYRSNADGSVSVYFKVCAESDSRPAGMPSLGNLRLAPVDAPADTPGAAIDQQPRTVELRRAR